MQELLGLIPAAPLVGCLLLGLIGHKLPRRIAGGIGVGATALAAALTGLVGWSYLQGPQQPYTQTIYEWISVGRLRVDVGFTLDPLSLVMAGVITLVGTLILLYSAQSMAHEENFARFFAWMNLFVGSMLVLVLADNLLLLYLGWEGVGLCSYLLIGFWYKERANARAALKAFLVTRIGDAALLVGLLVIFTQLGTLQIPEAMQEANALWPVGGAMAVAAAALLLGGAVGKSAQLPLQTWLPDAMAGPTPVSALIHAATMVTAGVYLIARTYAIFQLAPVVREIVAIIGAVTLLLAAGSALTQRDIKRVLAYSTMSQVGYMFLALGVGAWSAAIFHLFTHAFFKALLFLGAGVVITSLDEEHDIFRMGGLWRKLPLAGVTFVVGAASLAALPWVTAGFFSKEQILGAAYANGGVWLWLAGLVGALLTSIYAFRMVFLVFGGEQKREAKAVGGWAIGLPLVVLAAGAMVGGYAHLPTSAPTGEGGALGLQVVGAAVSVLGILLAAGLYLRRPAWVEGLAQARVVEAVRRWWFAGWGFDWLYGWVFVRPCVWLARINRADFIDGLFGGIAAVTVGLHRLLSATQTGRVRSYVLAVGLGALALIAVVMLR